MSILRTIPLSNFNGSYTSIKELKVDASKPLIYSSNEHYHLLLLDNIMYKSKEEMDP